MSRDLNNWTGIMDIGTIKLKSPSGHKTAITVAIGSRGSIDIHFSRTSEGEALIRLPAFTAKQLSELLAKAAAQ
jgi:hypothetical protein